MDRKEIKKLSYWLTLLIVILIIIVVVIFYFVHSADTQEKFEGYYNYLISYMDEHFPDRYYVNAEGNVLYVHVWQPGVALYETMKNIVGQIEIQESFEPLAKNLYKDMQKRGLNYSVCLVLHNDLKTENILMWWLNGEFQEGVYY